jgi:uncharacterized protein DUF4345
METRRRSIWLGRLVLAGAALLLLCIAARFVADPLGAAASHRIVLESVEAVTIMRVSGGVFLGIALVLLVCLASDERLVVGLGVLAAVATSITLVRLLGVVVDGPAPFTLHVLKPEAALVIASTVAFAAERRRLRAAR